MKKLLAILCIVSLLTVLFPSALAATPVISVNENVLTVNYNNPNAKGKYTYVLLDTMERIALLEIDVGDTWTPNWTQEGLYKVRVFYKDKNGVTHSEESDYQEVRFSVQSEPLIWSDFNSDNSGQLPSVFTNPIEYNEPTPKPTTAPGYPSSGLNSALLFTLGPSQPTAAPTPAPAPTVAPSVTFPGTRPCFEHVNIRIRISDNDAHAATVGRSGPGTEMPQVATLNIGEIYQVLDCRIVDPGNVHWFMINQNGVTCWVASGRCERYQ
ncbi:MAG: hypothetical protein IKH30_16135 [Clostridia bacterium]|nr:hypothetical protein [Clostridia bacterium]